MTTSFYVYVGTYTDGDSEGLYLCRLDADSGAVTLEGVVVELDNPTFLALTPDGRFLYAVHDAADGRGAGETGAVSAYAVDPATGQLAFLNRQPSLGDTPCHIAVDATNRCALVANYRGRQGGGLAVLPIQGDGRLGAPTEFVQHQGRSVHPTRQTGPHAHSITLSPDNRFAFAADLGTDKVMIYRLDAERGRLLPNDPPFAPVAPGAGPRHFCFHPSGRYAYLINELDSTITAFAYDGPRGALAEIQTVATLPQGYQGDNTGADIHVGPEGRFLYGSNRGHDSVVILAIDGDTGRLSHVGHEPTQGGQPRNFSFDPGGRFLLAANQKGNSIVSFRRGRETGKLTPTGHVLAMPAPVCLKMIPVAGGE